MSPRTSRTRRRAITIAVLSTTLALAVPSLVGAADFTVESIPGEGWIQGPDNTAGGSARIVEGPGEDIQVRGSVELTSEGAGNFAGIGRPVVQPLDDVTGASWRTYVTGETGGLDAEAASLRFGGYRLGGTNEFTTLSVEPGRNGTLAAGVWQTTTLSDSSEVWQSNATGAFCIQADPCTFAEFKTQYPDANVIGVQLAIGTAVPAVSSYVDIVSLTIDGTTDTWDFELPADGASDATIGDPVPTGSGADVTITLTASDLSVEPRTFTITVGGETQEVTLEPGETAEITVSVPFGSTDIEVETQGEVVASAVIDVAAPTPSPSPTAGPTGSPAPTASTAPTASVAPTTAVTPPPTDGVDPKAQPSGMDGRLLALFAVGVLGVLALTPRRRRAVTNRR